MSIPVSGYYKTSKGGYERMARVRFFPLPRTPKLLRLKCLRSRWQSRGNCTRKCILLRQPRISSYTLFSCPLFLTYLPFFAYPSIITYHHHRLFFSFAFIFFIIFFYFTALFSSLYTFLHQPHHHSHQSPLSPPTSTLRQSPSGSSLPLRTTNKPMSGRSRLGTVWKSDK